MRSYVSQYLVSVYFIHPSLDAEVPIPVTTSTIPVASNAGISNIFINNFSMNS
jgi:hypothetical protein